MLFEHRLVGRAGELSVLAEALERALDGRATTVLVGGEPGIGKTRLLEELERLAGARSIPVLWGRATDEEGAPAYWPWRQVLRAWFADAEPSTAAALLADGRDDLARIAPELAASTSTASPASAPAPAAASVSSPATTGAEDRFVLFDRTARLLAQAAEARGLVVLLDDLQFADTASQLLLGHLVRELRQARLLLVGSFRSTELHRSGDTLASVVSQPSVVRVDLAGLTATEVGDRLASILGAAPATEVVDTVLARTAGNPFFVEEVGRVLASGSDTSTDADAVPDRVRATIVRRLAPLSPSCRAFLADAAVVGAEIDPALVAAVGDVPVDDALSHLDEATAHRLVLRSRSSAGLRFAHDLVRECVLAELATDEQSRCHLRTAEVLAGRDPVGQVAAIAHHRLEALPLGDPTVAIETASAAAQQAMDQLAFEDAARLLGRAVVAAHAAGLESERRSRLLVDQARAQHAAGDVRDAMATCEEAVALGRQAGDAEAIGLAAVICHDVAEPDRLPIVRGWCDLALAGLPEADTALRARVLAQAACSYAFEAGASRQAELSAAAVAMAERLDDLAATLAALRARQLATAGAEGTEERLALGDRALEIGARWNEPGAVAWGHLWRFDALVQLGRIDAAEAELDQLERLVSQAGARPLARWHLLRSRSAVAVARGRFDEALGFAGQAAELARQGQDEGAVRSSVAVVGAITIYTGIDYAEHTAELAHAVPPPRLAPLISAVISLQLLAMGERDEARRIYAQAQPAGWFPSPFMQIIFDAHIAMIGAAFGDRPTVEAMYERLLPISHRHVAAGAGVLYTLGSTHLFLGVAAASLGRPDAAVEHLREAIASNTTAGVLPAAVESRVTLAEVLLERDAPGDAAEARELATSVAADSARLGMQPAARRADVVLSAGGPDARDAGSANPLSARETEIAELVADGLTNKEIAERTYISLRTAQNHVQHILTKLGFTTRSQIASWATRRRLEP